MKTPQYFIAFYQTIPEDKWCTGKLVDGNGKRCAFGLLGCNKTWEDTEDGKKLQRLFNARGMFPVTVNDGEDYIYQQDTPKQRILAALHDLLP